MREYCNPINISYKFQHYAGKASREAADPTLVLFQGRYYLFASMSGGFYWSEDLVKWQWHENRNLDMYRYAPDVHQVGDYLVFCASDRGKNSTFWRTKDPLSDQFEIVSEPFPFWDPTVFQDDDGKVYFYWGCDNGNPIFGLELDPERLCPIGEKKELVFGNENEHGWERPQYPGMPRADAKRPLVTRLFFQIMRFSGRGPEKPFIEGAFMNKLNGRYYLQYAAPGTELATYGNGVYVGDTPLGPFVYQSHNPFSAKPGGFITGAGHGSTIEDKYGNLWHAATMRVSVNTGYERRVGIFPAGIDKDGILFCNQSFADFPLEIPDGKFDPMSIKPRYMLLSYQKPCRASSAIPGHGPENAANENIRTSWCAVGQKNEWLEMDLQRPYAVHAVQINFAEVEVPMLHKPASERSSAVTSSRYIDTDLSLKTRWLMEGSTDGSSWFPLCDKRNADTDLSHDYIVLDNRVVRYIKITAEELPYQERFGISGLRVFGKGEGEKPAAVTEVQSVYTDPMTAALRWPAAKGAIGYDIKYGIAPDKLYLSHMHYGNPGVLLTMLNRGQKYYVRIDSFNEAGISEGQVRELARNE